MTCQGFKPDLRNSAVRHYRGAWGNAAMAELGTHLVTERASLVTLRLPLARPSSIPTSPVRAIALPGMVCETPAQDMSTSLITTPRRAAQQVNSRRDRIFAD